LDEKGLEKQHFTMKWKSKVKEIKIFIIKVQGTPHGKSTSWMWDHIKVRDDPASLTTTR